MKNIKSSINVIKSGVGNIGSELKVIYDIYYSSSIVNKTEDFNNYNKTAHTNPNAVKPHQKRLIYQIH